MAKNNINTTPTQDICNPSIIKELCKTEMQFVFMWATFPNIGEALKVLSVGF